MTHQMVAFSLPKIGETDNTIQDRFEISADRRLAAISDGAGSSLYPSRWAEILVASFCQSSANPIEQIQQSYQEWLKPAQEQWRQYYLAKLTAPNRKWWQGGSQIKNRGSATFLGLSWQRSNMLEERRWQAVAVGDSCLFKLEKNSDRLFSFPIERSQEFKATTPCFESLSDYPSASPQFTEGCYEYGDIFLLATDALAKWLLSDYENQGEQWRKCFELQKPSDFRIIIERLRQEKLIKNDDTTAVTIEIMEEISQTPIATSASC